LPREQSWAVARDLQGVRKGMAKKKRAKSAVPYVQRLVADEYVQEHLRNAAKRLREAYGRVLRQRGGAAEDKQL